MFVKSIQLLYAVGAYAASSICLVYVMGFLINQFVTKGISDGEMNSVWSSILVDVGLIFLFGLHHSITARRSFKKWWTRIIPQPIERATYLYMTSGMTFILIYFWQPIPQVVWSISSEIAIGLIYTLYASVWLMMTAATFHFGYLNFFGLMQVWQNFRNSPPSSSQLTIKYLYSLVRHPISVGWMVAPLVVPTLTIGHIVFALATMVYVLIATHFEESDLVIELGDSYTEYQAKVPAFIPFTKGNSS